MSFFDFLMVARELGPGFLKRGVLVPGVRLKEFMERQDRRAGEGCLSVNVGGWPLEVGQAAEPIANSQWIRLSVPASG